MTNDEKKEPPRGPPNRAGHIECLFETADIIHVYTSREAVRDGVLFEVQELSKISPSIKWEKGPFQYVTTNLAIGKGYIKDDKPNIPNFLDLFRTVHEYMRHAGPETFYSAYVEFPDGQTGRVYAKQNETGRYTLMLPEDD